MNDTHVKIVTITNIEEETVAKWLNTIKDKNLSLYNEFFGILKNENGGIREDVLRFFSKNAECYSNDQESVFQVCSLVKDCRIAPVWFAWLHDSKENIIKEGVSFSDIIIVVNEIIDHDIPFEAAKDLFIQENYNILKILERIVDGKESNVVLDGESIDPEEMSIGETSVVSDQGTSAVISESIESGIQMSNMFDDMIKAMSVKGRGAGCSVLDVQDGFNRILAKFQLALTEMTAYSTEIIREWEKDKNVIDHLNGLYSIYQKMITNQQRKISEQANEITKLKVDIMEAEERAAERESIIRKITELQLSANSATRKQSSKVS